ncbi:hypothetical protein HG530_008248 [Fusarium avenaceum]|nr:hypothetical protein HG530_008248 [Fusarium avenaceum]
MDPLSITTAVVGLTATCLTTSKKLHDIAGDYGDIPVLIAAICSESTIIGIALSELQTKILQRNDLSQAWASRTEIWAAFEMALTGCMVVFSCLEAETRHLQSKNSGVWAKFKFMWNQERFKELLAQLRGQQTSITFLLKLLEMDTLSSIQEDIRQNARRMQDTAAEAQSLRSRTPSIKMQSQSIFDNSTSKLSVFEFEIVSGTEPSELDFEFDDIVVNSKVYRRELRKAEDVIQRSVPKVTLDEEILDEESDLDTIKLPGNDFALSKMLQRIVDSPSTHNAKTLHFESVDPLFKSRKLLDGIEEKVWAYQNESPSADHLSSVQVCYICDKTPEEHHSLVDQQPYYLHEGRTYCHLHFCKYHTSSCRACEFPIITPPHDPMHNQANNAFHPACYGIVNNSGLYVPVSIEGRKYIDSLNSGFIGDRIDVGIQRQHDVYV